MQGLFYHYLKGFVADAFGPALWDRIRERALIPERGFVLSRQYPDRYVHDVVESLREELGAAAPSRTDLLFRFGRYLGGCFRRDFPHYFGRFASAAEMVTGIEPVIHAELRRRDPTMKPPEIRVTPLPGGRLRMVYASRRRLCVVGRGLLDYVASAFDENVVIEESSCMQRGAAVCEMLIAFSGNGSPRIDASPRAR